MLDHLSQQVRRLSCVRRSCNNDRGELCGAARGTQ